MSTDNPPLPLVTDSLRAVKFDADGKASKRHGHEERLQEWTQPFHRGYGVGGPHKTTILFTVLLAASATTANPTRGYLSRSR